MRAERGAQVIEFDQAARDPEPPALIPNVLPWIHEAGNPYFDWFWGSPELAREKLQIWMRNPASEVAIDRVTLMRDEGELVGAYIAMGGAELRRCRKTDLLAAIRETSDLRSELMHRMQKTRDLFSPVEDDEFYLSKIGVTRERRGQGLGKRCVEHYLAAGAEAGFRRFRLDVSAQNEPAINLYTSLCFEIAGEGGHEAGLHYVAMSFER